MTDNTSTTNTAARELLPCPFCGATWPSIALHSTLSDRCFRVMCICGAEGGPFTKRDDDEWGTMEEAVAAWNTRLTQQQGSEQEAGGGLPPVHIMRAAFVTADENYSGKRVAAVYADASMIGQRVHLIPVNVLRSKQPAASEGEMHRALQWIREETQGALGQRENLPLIEEAVAAYDPARVAGAGHTVHRNAGDSEANFIADGDRLNCPACGGSGHVDDASQRITEGDVCAIASELARIDGYDPEDEQGGLYHVVWSGQPPEPMGDVWNLEYMPRGQRIAKALGYRERPTVNA